MARSLSASMVTEVTSPVFSPIVLIKLEFDSGDVNLWTGVGDIVFNSDTYTGAGDLLDISPVKETSQLTAEGMSLTLTGISSGLISTALTENYQGRIANVWLASLDTSGGIVSTPYKYFRGRMDTMPMEDNGETATIQVNVENILIDLERSNSRRYTDEDQQAEFPGDLFFEFVTSLQDKEIVLE